MKKIIALCLFSTSIFSSVLTGCSSTPKTYILPTQDQFQGYKIIDGVDKDTVFSKISLSDNEKIAVVVRDIATTSYSFIEPRFMNSMVKFEGKSKCCEPTSVLMGNTGLAVYKFSFIGKGNTTINVIARQKGLSPTANSFDTDRVFTINVQVE